MSITLGQLRTFCQEIASKDAAGSTAEREFMHWINGAEERLYLQSSPDITRRQILFTVPPVDTSIADGVATLNSLTITSVTGFPATIVSDRYGIHITGEDRIEFEGATRVSANQVTLRAGDEWIQASATALAFYLVKNKFSIPSVAEIYSVKLKDGREVMYLDPQSFDLRKQLNPCYRSDIPLYFTLRNDWLEIWPSPSTNYYKLNVTYRLGFTPHSSAAAADGGDADSTVLVWPDRWLGVLKKAILIEAAVTQGVNAPVPYPIALQEFSSALGMLQDNAAKELVPGPLNVRTPITTHRRPHGRFSLPPGGTLSDA
jgi:hypothetical protein